MAFATTTAWDIRTTGNDANGGGFDIASTGTDFSQQNSPQVVFTDLVIGSTTTQCTSALNPFTAAHVGNIINVTSGTGFTVQRVQVVSVAGVTATCDKSLGTAASTGGAGNLGGSLANWFTATTAANTANTVWIKNGTYTMTVTHSLPNIVLQLIGYNAGHGDIPASGPYTNNPLITTATGNITLMEVNGASTNFLFQNLNFSQTAGTAGRAIANNPGNNSNSVEVVHCQFVGGFIYGIDDHDAGRPFTLTVQNCDFGPMTTAGIHNNGNFSVCNCTFKTGVIGIQAYGSVNMVFIARNIFSGGSSAIVSSMVWSVVQDCTFFGQSGDAAVFTAGKTIQFGGNVVYGSSAGFGVNPIGSIANSFVSSGANAFGGNASGNVNGYTVGAATGDITGISNPFTATPSDLSLNSTAGAGALLRGAGYPGITPLGSGHLDIGALQSGGAAAAAAVPTVYVV